MRKTRYTPTTASNGVIKIYNPPIKLDTTPNNTGSPTKLTGTKKLSRIEILRGVIKFNAISLYGSYTIKILCDANCSIKNEFAISSGQLKTKSLIPNKRYEYRTKSIRLKIIITLVFVLILGILNIIQVYQHIKEFERSSPLVI